MWASTEMQAATSNSGSEQEPADHPVAIARGPGAIWLKKPSLDILTLWGTEGVGVTEQGV